MTTRVRRLRIEKELAELSEQARQLEELGRKGRRARERDAKRLRQNLRRGDWSRFTRGAFRRPPNHKHLAEVASIRVLDKLNNEPHRPETQRVARLIELFTLAHHLHNWFRTFFLNIEDLQEFLLNRHDASQPFYLTQVKISNKFPHLAVLNTKLNLVLGELYKSTSRYRWHPAVRHFGYQFPGGAYHVHYRWKAGSDAEEWENGAVRWLLARDGEYLDRIRRCLTCKRWYWALVEHQQYCSEACRRRDHANSQRFKQRRAEYMREYRRRESEQNKRAKANVRRRGQ